MAEFVPKLPPIFQKLVEKALAKDPASRFQAGEEFAKTLRALKERLDKAMAQAGKGGGPRTGAPDTAPAGPSAVSATQLFKAVAGSPEE